MFIFPAKHFFFLGGLLYAINGEPADNGATCGFTIDYERNELVGMWCPLHQLTRPHDVAVLKGVVRLPCCSLIICFSLLLVCRCMLVSWKV